MSKIPLVAIVGPPNAGKSSLFNRLVGRRQAIVYDQPGTTRDSVQNIISHKGKSAWLLDTAGIEKATGELTSSVQNQVEEAIAVADVVVMCVDAKSEPNQHLRQIAKNLLKSQKPVILSVNKLDTTKDHLPEMSQKLGIKTIVGTSAIHDSGIQDLLDAMFLALPRVKATQQVSHSLALVGRPNVGKSSIFNILSGQSKAVVSDTPGTTRDVNRYQLQYHGTTYQLLDTAGLRRKSQAKNMERISWLRTIEAINECDVAVLVVDATEPSVAADQRIAGFIKEAGKGMVVAINKWDQLKDVEGAQATLEAQLQHDFGFAWWAPLVLTSATSGHNVKKLLQISTQIIKRRQAKLPTAKLNSTVQAAMAKHPPAGLKNRHPKLKYVTQTGINPPEITLFGSHLGFLHWSYQRYIENNLREQFDLVGTPIKLKLKDNQ